MNTSRILIFVLSFFVALTASAQTKSFGSWIVGEISENEGVYAATINDSQGIIGQYCYKPDGNCFWVLSNSIDCEEDGSYATLINSDYISTTLELICFKINDQSRFAFKSFESIDTAIKNHPI